jgi:hypothetical protein
MKKKTAPKCGNYWIDMIVCASGIEDKIPEGWVTIEEFAAAKSIPPRTAEGIMKREMKAGNVQRKQFRRICGSKTIQVWHYNSADA